MMEFHCTRTVTFSVLLLVGLVGPRRSTAADDSFQKEVAPFLKKHCHACHGTEKQEALIRYDKLDGFRIADRNLWTMVHEKLTAGEMPPVDHPQPTAEEKKQLLTWIEERQRALGTGSTRRLNRRELSAALRDVTGLEVNYADALPGDGKIDGFDTGAEGLQDAADSVAEGLRISRRAVDGIRFLQPASGKVVALNLREAKSTDIRKPIDARQVFDAWKNDGVTVKGQNVMRQGQGLFIEPRAVGDRDTLSIAVPTPSNGQGVLRLKLVVSALKPIDGIPNPHLWVEVGKKDIDFREITGTFDQPQQLSYEIQLEDLAVTSRGISINLSNKVEIPYAVDGFDNEDKSRPEKPIEGGTGLFRPTFDRKALSPEKQPVPFIVLQSIEIETGYVALWPPAAWQASVGEIQDNSDSAKRLLGHWIERAWRRPASATEQERFLKLYGDLRKQEMSFDDALRAAFQSVLLSSPFRYLASPTHPNPVVGQHAIASRLSFMLIGAPPDEELRKLAAANKLRDPAVLDAQVVRLLADSRSQDFVRPFVTQWLETEQPITIAQADVQQQDFRFARYLKASMREETVTYIAQMLIENKPAKELIVSDWTMMNNTLAMHYGYGGVEGGHLRKVQLRKDDPRGGGILGHAGIQSMLCWMGDNWVIYRGAWALRHILDDPPPPAPLEVPELLPSDAGNHGKTYRELLKQHQADSKCSVCHKSMDPVGFAFQNFDISGRWREVEHEKYERGELDGRIAWKGAGKTRPVDAEGHLPRGEEFKTFAEFKHAIVKDYQQDLVRGLMKNFMIYATGRKPEVDDLKEIKTIMKELQPQGYPVGDLVKAVVRSRAFLDH